MASHHKNNKHKEPLSEDLVPIVFGTLLPTGKDTKSKNNKKNNYVLKQNMSHTLNPNKTGQSTYVKILLDSGASASIINEKYARKENYFLRKTSSNTWTTMAGSFATSYETEVKLQLSELFRTAHISAQFHVTKQESAYDLIFGRNLLRELGIILNFNKNTVECNNIDIPMKPRNCTSETHFAIQESENVQNATARIKKILDAKYEKADLKQVVKELKHLCKPERKSLLKLLQKYESMFDGTLGTYTGSNYKIELQEGVKPYHAKPFPIPRVHEKTLRKEVDRLVKIGVLKRINNSEWAAPTFIIPKKNGTVRFISDFRELNKRIKRKPYPIPKIHY